LDRTMDAVEAIQRRGREGGSGDRPPWPLLVLREPQGWAGPKEGDRRPRKCARGPKEVDGLPAENSWRSHQVPFGDVRGNDDHRALLESWLRSYRPEELFDADGSPRADILALAPRGDRRISANPITNAGGEQAVDLVLPDFRDHQV